MNPVSIELSVLSGEAVFTKGERDWYVLLHQRVSTMNLIYVSRALVIVKLFTDVYSNATK